YRVSCLAFMDDTTWVANSRSELQKVLDDAAQFYKANDSQINGSKSQLIAINCKPDERLNPIIAGTHHDHVFPELPHNPVCFLGVFFCETDHKKAVVKIITNEIKRFT